MAAASRRLRDLQSQTGNETCVDCSHKDPIWAFVSYRIFMCLECSGKRRGLGVHISFVIFVTMDSWFEIQLKKVEACGNDKLNMFLQHHQPKQLAPTPPPVTTDGQRREKKEKQCLGSG
ncbi:ADP-ribosylation factor GTPase-activating protein AGD7-like [Chenopodium quinoa]|uniref:ADP-ribosylation factor GTPase-activating protein AGD7-like n=1 Tax=Chenopodium quinoa TaxID=63459 RepID=UPI000B786A69|nr:ADP-ribosylation factor GTPase-activating protein AGD7-like [Chenopodium quinoa]